MTNSFAGAGQQGAVPFTATMRHAVSPGASRLDISIEDLGRTRWLCLRGTLDTASAACAYDTIVASAAAPARQLHLDLNGLDAATRAGCRAIHVAAKLLQARGGRMTIFGARPTVAAVLKHAGFDALFAFRDDRAPSDVADPSVPGVTSPDLREVA